MEIILLLAHMLIASLSPEAISTTDGGGSSDDGTVIVKGEDTENADFIISRDVIP